MRSIQTERRTVATHVGKGNDVSEPALLSQQEQDPLAYLQRDEFASSGAGIGHQLVAFWYRLAAFDPPKGRSATPSEREKVRASRFASIILVIQFVGIFVPVIPVVLAAPNHAIVFPWLISCILALFVALVFIKKGYLLIAGFLMVASIEVTMVVKILTIPGGISIFYLTQFDILIQPILIAVALLPAWSAFAVALFNMGFILLALSLGLHAPDLTVALHTPSQVGEIFSVPNANQLLTAVFTFLIVRNLRVALKRADQAEQVAKLEHMVAEQAQQSRAHTQQLQEGVEAIVEPIHLVSRGNMNARVHLPTDNMLWAIGKQVNLFIERYQAARLAEIKLEALSKVITWYSNEIYQAARQKRPIQIQRTNTVFDGVLMALSHEERGNSQTTKNELEQK